MRSAIIGVGLEGLLEEADVRGWVVGYGAFAKEGPLGKHRNRYDQGRLSKHRFRVFLSGHVLHVGSPLELSGKVPPCPFSS